MRPADWPWFSRWVLPIRVKKLALIVSRNDTLKSSNWWLSSWDNNTFYCLIFCFRWHLLWWKMIRKWSKKSVLNWKQTLHRVIRIWNTLESNSSASLPAFPITSKSNMLLQLNSRKAYLFVFWSPKTYVILLVCQVLNQSSFAPTGIIWRYWIQINLLYFIELLPTHQKQSYSFFLSNSYRLVYAHCKVMSPSLKTTFG